jgi:hypothetical protein
MTALRVKLDPCAAALHRSVLAGLPGRFVVADHGPAEVTVVSGRNPEWPDDVARAVHDGVRGVLLTRPGLVDADRVHALSAAVAGRAVVAVDTPYANDRSWAATRREVAADAGRASIVDSVVSVVGGDLVAALIDQLTAVAGLVDTAGLRLLHHTASGYLAATGSDGPSVTLAGVAGVAGPDLSIDVVAVERRWQVRFDGTAPAAPTEVTLHDRTGAHTSPLTYQSGHRAAWDRLHQAITGAATVDWSLDSLADTLAVAGRLLGGSVVNNLQEGSR